jgi:uncharacterized ParB-like nuclease family protein
MRSGGTIVKPLARFVGICHRVTMAKDAADKERIKAERLREALRANLRRRKAPQNQSRTDKIVSKDE